MDILSNVRELLNKTKIMLSEKTEDDNFGLIVEGILLVIVSLLGIVGNLGCILAFCLKRNKNTFHHLMLGKFKRNTKKTWSFTLTRSEAKKYVSHRV